MPESRTFLYNFPLTISNASGVELLTHIHYTLSLRTFWSDNDGNSIIRRFIEIKDYTIPNNRGIPAALFFDKTLALPFIRREYLSFLNITNEAEIRLRSISDPFTAPSFVRTNNISKAKDLILTYMMFLEMYIQGDDVFESEKGSRLTREDIALLMERHFDLSKLSEESLLHAKIMLWYVEPVKNIFNITEADDTALSRINEYIESIYGKPLSAEEAIQKARAIIAAENENITKINNSINENSEQVYPLLEEGSHQWTRLFNILVKSYTSRNTLTLWELRGILYDMNQKLSKPFYYPVTSAIGRFFKKSVSGFIRSFEKDYKWFIKFRQWHYRFFYNCLDILEKEIDLCGWREFGGKCLRLDRQCCTVPVTCEYLSDKKCGLKGLSCKFWLCSAARARAASSEKGRFLLALRCIFSFWCQMLNVPLKVRCSFVESFNEKSKEPFVDVSDDNWFDKPMQGKNINNN